jgi:2-octaprenylphenol hydroxylase
MPKRYQIVVVGGGLVGATTVCGLAQQGLDVALLDARPPARQWPKDSSDLRVSALTRASINILQALGVWSKIQQTTSPYREMKIWDHTGNGELHFDSAETDYTELGFIVENRVTVAALWDAIEALPNATILCPAHVAAMQIQNDCRRLQLDDGRVIEAELVIAADGQNSGLREMAGINVTGWAYQQMALVATVKTSKHHQVTAWQRFLKEGPLAFLPLHNGQCSIVWTLSTDTAKRYQDLDEPDFLKVLEQASAGMLGTMLEVGPRAAFPLHLQFAKQYTEARLALVGDAAHTMHPLAGQGANAGLLDAATIIELLINARAAGRPLASYKLLRRYERWRKGDNLILLGSMDMLKRLYAISNEPFTTIRAQGMNKINQTAWLKNHFNQYAMGLRADMPTLAKSSTA